MKAVAALLLFILPLVAQAPVALEYACPPEDVDGFGLACSAEDPCAVFLELSSVEAVGAKLFAAGNLHTASTTLYSILLTSEDSGKTWTEPWRRVRAAALEQIQFLDFGTGWISGQIIEPLPKDPFMLLTTDGGKTWRQQPVFEESRFVSISQFWFDSRTTGQLVLDHRERGALQHEVYETNTGGENWEAREVTTKAVTLKGRPTGPATWRLRADGPSKTYRIERRGSPNWETIASFQIHVTDCK